LLFFYLLFGYACIVMLSGLSAEASAKAEAKNLALAAEKV